jgi:PKD repeat protein
MAQAGMWTWMKGSSTANSTGTFGILGVADILNTPPALYSPFVWTDLNGYFWLYGGARYSNQTNNIYSALWKFDPLINTWTWVNGSSAIGAAPVYGTIGIPSPTNQPGARAFAGLSWIENNNLWLYGGGNYVNDFSDLWKYDIGTGEWTCMGNFGYFPQHGVQGTGSPSNSPGIRSETSAAFTDGSSNLWFFGGQSFLGSYNDVWKYEMSTGNWVWMQGDTTGGLPGTLADYGPMGVFGNIYTPGSRNVYAHWQDANGNLWIFGGGNPYALIYADLWQFDPDINQWAWMGGDTTAFYGGNFISTCDTINDNLSRGVVENRASWIDKAGNMWKIGGGSNNMYATVNDLWVYNPSLQKWVWVDGTSASNPNGIYGTQGVADPANVPPGRLGSANWLDQNCHLWYFGGRNANLFDFNDLWRYEPDPDCFGFEYCSSLISFVSSDQSICEKFCVDFFDVSSNSPTSWLWQFPGGSPASSTSQNPSTICYNNPGTYDVTLITTNSNGTDTLTLPGYLSVYPTPLIPTITQTGYTLTSTAATTYQWQFNSINIPGATNQSYDVTQTGYYTVFITDQNGCSASATFYVLITGIDEVYYGINVSIYPNPSDGNITVEWFNGLMVGDLSIEVLNTLGQVVYSSKEKIDIDHFSKIIDLHSSPAGVYFLGMRTDKTSMQKKFVISR